MGGGKANFKAVSGVLISKQWTSMDAEISKPLKSTGPLHTSKPGFMKLTGSGLLGCLGSVPSALNSITKIINRSLVEARS